MLLLALQLSASVFAASQACHDLVHPGESSSSHQCLATLLLHGQAEAGCDLQLLVEPPFFHPVGSRLQATPTPSLVLSLLPPGRAPPV